MMSDFITSKDGLFYKGEKIADFYPIVKQKRIIFMEGSDDIRVEYDIAIVISEKELDTHTVKNLQTIPYSVLWNECIDANITPAHRKRILEYMQIEQSENAIKVIEVSKLGFLKKHEDVYIFDRGHAFGVKNRQINIWYSNEAIPKWHIIEETSEKELISYCKELFTVYESVSDVLFAAALCSVLRPLYIKVGLRPQLFINLTGEAGSLKTTFARLFFVRNEEQCLNFSQHNRRDVQKMLSKYQGHTVVIDDYHFKSQKAERERMLNILDIIARMVDNDCGALAIVTGEYLTGNYSLQNRMIPVKMCRRGNKSEIKKFLNQLTYLQNNQCMLDTVLCRFSEYVYNHMELVKTWIDGYINNGFLSNSSDRIVRNAEILKLSFYLFIQVFPEMKDLEDLLSNSISKIVEIHKRHMEIAERLETPDWAEEIYKLFCHIQLPREYKLTQDNIMNDRIVIQEDYISITRNALEENMEKFLETKINLNEVITDLEQKEILCTDNSASKTKKIGGIRFYVINRQRLYIYHQRKYGTAQ